MIVNGKHYVLCENGWTKVVKDEDEVMELPSQKVEEKENEK